jgi:predicted dehydrogenase/threonine dehydrogenase-like Zn-dependent dehydrogenase
VKILAQKLSDGSVEVLEAPPPLLAAGCVRVRTRFSCISPGTEGLKVVTGKKSLLGKARARPQQVRQVWDMARDLGLQATLHKVRSKLEGASPLGYSLCGEVSEVAPDVSRFKVGDHVACAGGGYAVHADEVVVPANLVVKVPAGVAPDAAAMTTLGAIALQGVRQAQPTLGENAVVIGLGVIGMLTGQLLRANGCRVLGVDIDPVAVARAAEWGCADEGSRLGHDPTDAQVSAFSGGHGADMILICAGTESNEPVASAGRWARKRGRVVVVGGVGLTIPREDYYEKELAFSVSCSYGPGRYDPVYEEKGADYPYGYVRWTENRNMQAVLDLVASGRLDPLALVTHRYGFETAARAYELIAARTEPFCGILLEYPVAEIGRPAPVSATPKLAKPSGRIGIGFVGAGSFAQTFLLPPLKGLKKVQLTSIFTRSGLGAADAAKRFGFQEAVSSLAAVLGHPGTDAIFIATRHDQHAPAVLAGLEAGKHVFVEKPLCLTLEELSLIARMSRRLEAEGTLPLLLVGYNRRFWPAAGWLKQGFGERPGPLTMMYRINAGRIPRDHWAHDPVLGGGRIMGEVCHFVDLMQFLTGAEPVMVDAMCIATDNAAVTAADNVLVTIGFSDGSIGSIGYLAEGASGMPKERLEVLGAGRSGVIDNFRQATLYTGRQRRVRRCSGKGHAEEIAAFIDAIAAGRPPIPVRSLLATTLTTLKILECLKERRRQTVDIDALFSA